MFPPSLVHDDSPDSDRLRPPLLFTLFLAFPFLSFPLLTYPFPDRGRWTSPTHLSSTPTPRVLQICCHSVFLNHLWFNNLRPSLEYWFLSDTAPGHPHNSPCLPTYCPCPPASNDLLTMYPALFIISLYHRLSISYESVIHSEVKNQVVILPDEELSIGIFFVAQSFFHISHSLHASEFCYSVLGFKFEFQNCLRFTDQMSA